MTPRQFRDSSMTERTGLTFRKTHPREFLSYVPGLGDLCAGCRTFLLKPPATVEASDLDRAIHAKIGRLRPDTVVPPYSQTDEASAILRDMLADRGLSVGVSILTDGTFAATVGGRTCTAATANLAVALVAVNVLDAGASS